MSFVAVATGGAALIGAGASIYAGNKAAGAQKDVASQNAALQQQQNQEAQRQYDLSRADLSPYREVGTGALYKLSDLMGVNRAPVSSVTYSGGTAPSTGVGSVAWGDYVNSNPDLLREWTSNKKVRNEFGDIGTYGQWHYDTYGKGEGRDLSQYQQQPTAQQQQATQGAQTFDTGVSGDEFGSLDRRFTLADFEKDPGYEFRRSEGQKGVEASAAARGGILSGAALKAIDRYNSDYASSEYGNAYNRFNNDMTTRFNRLSALAGTGQTAANSGAAAGQNLVSNLQQGVNNISSANNAAGNARASQYAGIGQAVGNAANQVGQYFALRDLYKAPAPTYAMSGTGTPMNLTGTGI